MLVHRIRVSGRTQPCDDGPSLAELVRVHRIEIEVANPDALFLGDGKGCGHRGCSAIDPAERSDPSALKR